MHAEGLQIVLSYDVRTELNGSQPSFLAARSEYSGGGRPAPSVLPSNRLARGRWVSARDLPFSPALDSSRRLWDSLPKRCLLPPASWCLPDGRLDGKTPDQGSTL